MGVDLKGVKREFCKDERNYQNYADRNEAVGGGS